MIQGMVNVGCFRYFLYPSPNFRIRGFCLGQLEIVIFVYVVLSNLQDEIREDIILSYLMTRSIRKIPSEIRFFLEGTEMSG